MSAVLQARQGVAAPSRPQGWGLAQTRAFQFTVELDRNTPEVRMKALVSSASGAASDLDSIAATAAHKAIAGAGFEPATFGL